MQLGHTREQRLAALDISLLQRIAQHLGRERLKTPRRQRRVADVPGLRADAAEIALLGAIESVAFEMLP